MAQDRDDGPPWGWILFGAAVALLFVKNPFAPPIVAAPEGPAQPRLATQVTDVDRETIRDVQDKLREIGFEPGPSTGEWNHETNFAIARFQQREGIVPADGVLNGTTAMRLVAVYERKTGQREVSFANRVYALFLPPPGRGYGSY